MKRNVKVPVIVNKGMFSSEYSVSITTKEGKKISFFVDENMIIKNKNKNYLRLSCIKSSKANDICVFILPVEPLENKSRFINMKYINNKV